MEEVKIYGAGSDVSSGADVLENSSTNGIGTCRLCLKACGSQTTQWDLFDTDLPQKLMAIAAIQIQQNDDLPTAICTDCRNLVCMSYDFKCQIEKCDHDLRQALLLRQSTTNCSTIPIIKPAENINTVEDTESAQKNVNTCLILQNKQNKDNHEQFIFEITNICNIESNTETLKKNQTQFNNFDVIDNTTKNTNNTISFQSNNSALENESNKENSIVLETHNGINNEIEKKSNIEKIESENIKENSNQSEDEKPLILRTKRHKCNYCIKSFANLSLLEKHAVIHKKPKVVYACFLCDEQFSKIDEIKNHGLEVHKINMDTHKKIENSETHQISSKNTVENQDNNKYTCKFCYKQFTYYKFFMAHIQNHPDYNDKVLNKLKKESKIEETGAQSVNKEQTSHAIEAIFFSEDVESISQSSTDKDASCSENGKDSSKEDIFKNNNSSQKSNSDKFEHGINDDFHDNDDDEDDDDIEDQDMLTAMKCNECGKRVATLQNLKRHLLTHSGLKHTCLICGKNFSRQDKLREHQQLKHKEELFGKSDTDNEFSDDHNSVATRKKGKNKRPYKCSLCPKAFVQAQSLANHEERHRRSRDIQKRFLCEVCSKIFAQRGSLAAHMRTHTGVKPYVCNVCSRAFTKSTYLQLHLRTHSGEKPYICQYCNRAFARANTLARHITMHTGEAKYQCQICSKSFRRLTSLNEHTYTHTGQRPYACKICSKRYNNAGSLYAHTKKCKTMEISANTPSYPVSLENSGDDSMIPQNENNVLSQFFIITEKTMNETIDDFMTPESSSCQFMIANVHTQKPMTMNVYEPFTIQEPDIYNMNSKHLKTPNYGFYPSM